MRPRITNMQGILLIVITIIPTAVLVIPSVTISLSQQHAWLSVLIGMVFALFLVLLYDAIGRLNTEERSFLGFVEHRAGWVAGRAVGLFFFLNYLILSATTMREFVNFLSDQVMPDTPVAALMAVTLAVVLYTVRQGIEVIARLAAIVMSLSYLFFLADFGLLINQIHLTNLLPVSGASIRNLAAGSLPAASWLSESSILLLLAPYLKNRLQIRKVGLWGILIASVTLLCVVLLVLVVLGAGIARLTLYPGFSIVGLIQISNFLERIDVFFISVWVASVFVKQAIFLFATHHCFIHAFRIRYEQPFLIAIGLIVLFTALKDWPDSVRFYDFQKWTTVPGMAVFSLLMPLALWAVLLAAGQRKKAGG